MKKLGIKGILGIFFTFCGLVFIALSVFTDINDGLFLPIALGCVCISSLISFIMQRKAKKTKDDENTE